MSCINFGTVLNDFVPEKVMRQNVFPLLSKALLSRMYSCYGRLFLNVKKTKNTTLSLVGLLAIR